MCLIAQYAPVYLPARAPTLAAHRSRACAFKREICEGFIFLFFPRLSLHCTRSLVLASALMALPAKRTEPRTNNCRAPPERLHTARRTHAWDAPAQLLHTARDAHACHAALQCLHTARDAHAAGFPLLHSTVKNSPAITLQYPSQHPPTFYPHSTPSLRSCFTRQSSPPRTSSSTTAPAPPCSLQLHPSRAHHHSFASVHSHSQTLLEMKPSRPPIEPRSVMMMTSERVMETRTESPPSSLMPLGLRRPRAMMSFHQKTEYRHR